jgi:hypothetical protein
MLAKRTGFAAAFVAALLMVLGALLLASTEGKGATDETKPPPVTVKQGKTYLQTGRVGWNGTNWWYYENGGWQEYYLESGEGLYYWPAVDRVAPGSKVTFRVYNWQHPERFYLTAYSKLDESNGEHRPGGKGVKLERTKFQEIRAHNGRTVGWKTTVTLPGTRQYYIVGRGSWMHHYGNAHAWGKAEYLFHLRT